ncbi:Cysteine-rich receptor-like protein kinase 2 [Heracleum sosnowskyi]|uniref:Cysteine-rich receptor-like protein kinase 2 n=1 Tax=Heracleum sosnowskyi TaxID=360622 RepID=A0AAD8HT73_9APIA|nr:Cysteine-rich receptor-like protein kinase 2 [Heracleum sosnowskyi]
MKQWWKTIVVVVLAVTLVIESGMSDPQTNKISQPGRECSQFNAGNPIEFFTNLNATLADLRRQLFVDKTHFATAQQASTANPVYSLFQCRNYLSTADCVACFDKATVDIREICNLGNGAWVIYDGCFLRYELRAFYTEIEFGLSSEVCRGNQSVPAEAAFKLVVVQLLKDLADATPKIKSYFAVAKRQVFNGGRRKFCSWRLFGCFLRYSATSFFTDNDITNITPYVDGGSSSTKTTIVAGGVGVISLLLLIILALLLWYRLLRKRKASKSGDLLGVTKLQGPTIYKYNDLKSATRNFSEEYKIGEGGFGDIYKGIIEDGNIIAVKKLVDAVGKDQFNFSSMNIWRMEALIHSYTVKDVVPSVGNNVLT